MHANVNHHPPVLVSSHCLIINDLKYIQDKLIRQNQVFVPQEYKLDGCMKTHLSGLRGFLSIGLAQRSHPMRPSLHLWHQCQQR